LQTEVVSAPAPDQEMKPYHDALRDRLVTYFDIRDMTHKPKLIAVTGCKEEAGVTSVASGLAASLSETGDGNVLLVDMRGQKGVAHAFARGKPACGLAEALENETRNSALVHENLYVVSAGSVDQKLQRIIPQQFSHFVPKLKASDYDYIIFDMPPVGQTSITAKVARFMDMVLMVIESEKTDRDVAKRAGDVLAESKASVAAVLNKRRRYVPAWLHQEFH
jgi:Mrp family chromosome partitioning ATPase